MRKLALTISAVLFFTSVRLLHAQEPLALKDLAGIYFLSNDDDFYHTTFRHLILHNDGTFDSISNDGTVTGKWTIADNLLSMTYFDGIERKTANISVALSHGHLLLGVGQRNGSKDWRIYASAPEFFGPRGKAIPPAEICYSEKTGKFTFSMFITGRLPLEFSVETIDLGNEQKRFTFKFPQSRASEELCEYLRPHVTWHEEDHTIFCPLGLIPLPPTPGPSMPLKPRDQAAWNKALQATGGFARQDDILLTPWAVDLGPAGLVPAKVDAKDMLGTWVSESTKRQIAILADAEVKPLALFLSPPSTDSFPFHPNAHGISIYSYGPPIPPHDAPDPVYHIVWIPLSPQRVACYSDSSSNKAERPNVEFFVRPPATQPK